MPARVGGRLVGEKVMPAWPFSKSWEYTICPSATGP